MMAAMMGQAPASQAWHEPGDLRRKWRGEPWLTIGKMGISWDLIRISCGPVRQMGELMPFLFTAPLILSDGSSGLRKRKRCQPGWMTGSLGPLRKRFAIKGRWAHSDVRPPVINKRGDKGYSKSWVSYGLPRVWNKYIWKTWNPSGFNFDSSTLSCWCVQFVLNVSTRNAPTNLGDTGSIDLGPLIGDIAGVSQDMALECLSMRQLLSELLPPLLGSGWVGHCGTVGPICGGKDHIEAAYGLGYLAAFGLAPLCAVLHARC